MKQIFKIKSESGITSEYIMGLFRFCAGHLQAPHLNQIEVKEITDSRDAVIRRKVER